MSHTNPQKESRNQYMLIFLASVESLQLTFSLVICAIQNLGWWWKENLDLHGWWQQLWRNHHSWIDIDNAGGGWRWARLRKQQNPSLADCLFLNCFFSRLPFSRLPFSVSCQILGLKIPTLSFWCTSSVLCRNINFQSCINTNFRAKIVFSKLIKLKGHIACWRLENWQKKMHWLPETCSPGVIIIRRAWETIEQLTPHPLPGRNEEVLEVKPSLASPSLLTAAPPSSFPIHFLGHLCLALPLRHGFSWTLFSFKTKCY